MATQLITPNEALDGSPGETSVLRFDRHSRLIVANPLIPRLFDEVSEGVRALPRGGAEIGGLLVGPKDQEGGVLANDIIPIPIEYRFGPSFRLSSPDLTKIEEAIATAHKDLSKTIVGFYRSRTRGGAEFRDSDQEILLAVELAHAAFATDFHYYMVLSPPQRTEMPLGLALRTGNDWSDFRPYTCHSNPLNITSDLGDPEEELEIPTDSAAPANLEEELAAAAPEIVAVPEELNGNSDEPAVVEPEAVNGAGDNQETAHVEPAQAEPGTMNVHSEEAVMVETEALHGDHHDSAKADMEELNGNGHSTAKKAKGTRTPKAASNGQTKAKAPKSETAARPRAKKTTTTAKSKARSTAEGAATARVPNTEPKAKPQVTEAPVVVAEPKLMLDKEPNPAALHLLKMRTQIGQIHLSKLTPRVSRQLMLWVAGVVTVAALATSGYFLLAKHETPVAAPAHPAAVAPAAKPQSLALTAERRGTDLILSWNRESPTVSHASYGMLIIKGKDGRRDIALTPDQLRAGSIVYTPTTDQVEVELSVVAGEQVTKDSVIVFLPHKGDKNAIVTTAQTQDTPQSPAAPQASSAQLNERERPDRASSSPPPGRELKPFSMPTTPAGPETAGLVHLDELPPSLPQRPGQTAGVISLPSPQLPSAPAPAPEVAAMQNRTPEKTSPAPVIVAAVATEQVLPRVPESMKALLTSTKTIEVNVSIDENGKVAKADASNPSHSDARLVAAALEAARHWKFQPARVNNRPVTSEMVVKFNFAPVR